MTSATQPVKQKTDGASQQDQETKRAQILLVVFLGLLIISVIVYLCLHWAIPAGGPLFPDAKARDEALAAIAQAMELFTDRVTEAEAREALHDIHTVITGTIAAQLTVTETRSLDDAFAEAIQTLAESARSREKARVEALALELEMAVSKIPWVDAKGVTNPSIAQIREEIAKEDPDWGGLRLLFVRVDEEVRRKGDRGFWSTGSWRWVDLAFWSLFGTLIFLLSELHTWYPKGTPGRAFIDYTPWYFSSLVRGPTIALLILFFITSVQAEVLGVNIAFADAPFQLLMFLAGVLGYFSRQARDQLEILVEKIFSEAWKRAKGLPTKMEIQPSSLTLLLGGKAKFKVEPDQDVIWRHEPKQLGVLGERGDFTASTDASHAGEQVTIRAISARDDKEFATAKITLVKLQANPSDANVRFTERQTFNVEPDVEVTWTIEPSDLGTITESGLYTAPARDETATATPGAEVTVKAILVDDRTTFATAKVTLVE